EVVPSPAPRAPEPRRRPELHLHRGAAVAAAAALRAHPPVRETPHAPRPAQPRRALDRPRAARRAGDARRDGGGARRVHRPDRALVPALRRLEARDGLVYQLAPARGAAAGPLPRHARRRRPLADPAAARPQLPRDPSPLAEPAMAPLPPDLPREA